MSDDRWSDPDIDFNDAADTFYSVPDDHPAFRQSKNNEHDNSDGYDPIEHDGTNHPASSSIIQLPVGRYDGFNGQDDQDSIGVPDNYDTGQRTADREYVAKQLERAGERTAKRALGQRNAIAHSRSTGEGTGSGRTDEPTELEQVLAASLEQAGVRFRDEWGSGSGNKPAVITRNPRGITKAPTFDRAMLWGQLSALKSNTAGDWIVTLRIDADCDEEVTKLAKAHGLNLEVAIRRKPRDE